MADRTPIRLGIVGLGRAGWNMHCRELEGKERMFQVAAACDLIEDRRQRAAERYGCAVYEEVADLVADPNVEMVDIATRSCDHYAHTRTALKAGKHVLLEKPMTTTYAEARRLQRLAARSEGDLYIRHNRRCEPGFLHVREIIASGRLGEVHTVQLFRTGYSRRDDWQTLTEFGGGQMLNWGPHIIDHALQLLESPVADLWSDLKRVAAVGDAEDHFKLVLRGENGRVAEITISGGAALGLPEYVIWGTRGALIGRVKELTLRYIHPLAKLPARKPDPGTPGASFGSPEELKWTERTIPVRPKKRWDIWDELYKAVRKGTFYPITLDQAVAVMRVVSEAKRGTLFQPKKSRTRG